MDTINHRCIAYCEPDKGIHSEIFLSNFFPSSEPEKAKESILNHLSTHKPGLEVIDFAYAPEIEIKIGHITSGFDNTGKYIDTVHPMDVAWLLTYRYNEPCRES